MPHDSIVTSPHNQWVKMARSLGRRKARYQERAFLVEGIRLVADALSAGAAPTVMFVDAEQPRAGVDGLLAQGIDRGARIVRVSPTIMRAIAETDTPQGLLAIFPLPEADAHVSIPTSPLVIIADAIHDPGNLGTLVRSALGAGANVLFVSSETVDPFSPKVVRAGMGAHFRLPILPVRWESPHPLLATCEQRLVAAAGSGTAYDRTDWTRSTCLIIGNEASGVSAEARAFGTGQVSIPLAGDLESLNAGVAGSVMLFEASRQRRLQQLRQRDVSGSVHTHPNT